MRATSNERRRATISSHRLYAGRSASHAAATMSGDAQWRPILSGVEADRAWQAIERIADTLPSPDDPAFVHDDARGPGLATGQAGVAIFHAYLAEARGRARDRDLAEQHLDRAAETLSARSLAATLFSGFVGIGWAVEHLTGRLFSRVEGEDPTSEIDEAVREELDLGTRVHDFDLVTGAVGLGVYALERPIAAGRVLFARVLADLEARAEATPEGLAFRTRPGSIPGQLRDQFPDGYFNLGLAHGAPGVVALLAAACWRDIERDRARSMLERTLAWLLAQRQPAEVGSAFGQRSGALEATRCAWCYGDPGVSIALLHAARALDDRELEQVALSIARAAADRSQHRSGVRDAGLCHGAAGLALIFNRLHQSTRDPTCLEAARTWCARTLDLWQPAESGTGFRRCHGATTEQVQWVEDPSLLGGAAGIGLALLSAVTPRDPAWDRMLLLSTGGP
jgi:lantibiotic modifying enzyme